MIKRMMNSYNSENIFISIFRARYDYKIRCRKYLKRGIQELQFNTSEFPGGSIMAIQAFVMTALLNKSQKITSLPRIS